MSAPDGQGGNPGSQQGGSGAGGQSNQGTITTTSALQSTTWSPSSSTTASHTRTPTATSTSTSTSSGRVRTGIIAGVLGGIGAVLIFSLAIICYLQRRKKRQIARKNGNALPVTYTGLNSAFPRLPLRQSQAGSHNSLLFASPLESTHSRIPLSRGAGSLGQGISAVETDYFLPSYTESQAGAAPNRFYSEPPAPTVSPLSTRAPTEIYNVSPQTTGGSTFPPQAGRDTMGFPAEREFTEIMIEPEAATPIISPTPRRPLVHQASLERAVRQDMPPGDSPVTGTVNPGRLGSLREEAPRDSIMLGHQSPPTTQHQPPPSAADRWVAGTGNGIGRNESQRTVSSDSSMGISIISDTELERLGVGSIPARQPVPR